jgi:Transglutaminase-like superfamily
VARLRKFLKLSPAERAVLVQAWTLFVVVDLLLRLVSFNHLLRLTRLGRQARCAHEQPASLDRLVWLVDVAARYAPVRPTCLTRALVLSRILGRRGLASELRIGVAHRDGGLAAHAWVERNGQPLADPAAPGEYEPLMRWTRATIR